TRGRGGALVAVQGVPGEAGAHRGRDDGDREVGQQRSPATGPRSRFRVVAAVAALSVTTGAVPAGSVTTGSITTGSVRARWLAPLAITSRSVTTGSITTGSV